MARYLRAEVEGGSRGQQPSRDTTRTWHKRKRRLHPHHFNARLAEVVSITDRRGDVLSLLSNILPIEKKEEEGGRPLE